MYKQFNIIYVFLLLFVAAGISCSCGKTRRTYKVAGEFRYYNKFSNTVYVTIRSGLNKAFEEYTIVPGDSLVISTTGGTDLKDDVDPMGYAPGLLADTTSVKFNDTTCYNEYNKSGAVLHKITSYTYQKRGDKDYIFFYTIDSSLYKQAGKCF